jgi:hypothetical protein
MYKKIETRNNVYRIKIEYERVSKYTHNQRIQRSEKFRMLLVQKVIGLLLMILCISFSLISKEGMALVLALIIGLPLFVSKEYILSI